MTKEKNGLTRRELLRLGAAGATAVLTGCADASPDDFPEDEGAPDAPARVESRRQSLLFGVKKKVAILGGGVAGLSAAQELAERGFTVTVYERKELGGKARSNTVPGSGVGGRPNLPGEHGYRGFLGYYHNLHDLLARIPVPEGSGGVRSRLIATRCALFSRANGADFTLTAFAPPGTPALPYVTAESLQQTLLSGLATASAVGPSELAYFVRRLLCFMTSCDERRYGQWENITWNQFLGTSTRSAEYSAMFARGLTRNLAAMRADDANANSLGIIGEATIYGVLGRGMDYGASSVDVLRGATNEMWIQPWVDYLCSLGVTFQVGLSVDSLTLDAGGSIASATLKNAAGVTQQITADWYVLAVPLERAAPLMNASLVARDARLGKIKNLRTDWMNGIQFYMRQPTPITIGGVSYVDSPWALTSISQGQFWKRNMTEYGDGTVKDIMSLAIADWVTPGILYGKTARQCTREEIAAECWAQMKAHVNDGATPLLRDDMVHSWWLDPAITGTGTAAAANDEPLMIQTPGSWASRPEADTKIPNFFLAADYVRTDINVTTMEGANIAARKAVNALLSAAGSWEPRVPIQTIFSPPELAAVKAADRVNYALGIPNSWDW